jgi:group II intron reverse transcriptase/maturase
MGQQRQSATNTKLNRIAWLSKQDSRKEFECLMHLFNQGSLIECFHELDKDKAVGVDGITKMEYGAELHSNIEKLITNMKNMAYRPGPVRERHIPKEGKPGATRPLGISNLEDKIVQRMTQKVLESIYEPLFLECSHGYRPKRSCQTAIKALMEHLYKNEIQTVIDIDLKNFFGTIDHEQLENILKDKIKDPKFMRYINRMIKSGVLTEGELKISEEGVPQGSICSPVLSNIFAHYAIDTWVEEMVKPASKGSVGLFRVICCQYEADAERIRQTLGKRLGKFKLQLNEEKTKLVPFNKRLANQGVKQGTFDFLGFTFYWGKAQSGWVIPKLKTKAKAMKTKLKRVNEWAKEIRNKKPLKEIWKIFKAKLRGHVQYYGVSHNIEKVNTFLYRSTKIMFKWLNRRSQRKSYTWEKFQAFMISDPLPRGKIVHPLF